MALPIPNVTEPDDETTLIGRIGEARRRPNAARDPVPTLPDAIEPFEHHDTIPAPPAWIDEIEEAQKQ